jgi:type VI secretion system protein ImpK
MSPNFSKAVDPIFIRVIEFLERIQLSEELSHVDIRERLRRDFEVAEAHLGHNAEWNLAKYALACWIDEVLLEFPWSGRDWWRENVLEQELFRTREAHSQFYVKAQEASALPRRDAFEVFYICVILGFRGLYRDPEESAMLAEAYQLPTDLETWVRQSALMIRQSDRPRIDVAPEQRGSAPPLEAASRIVWGALVGVVLLVVIAVIVGNWYTS